MPWWAGLGVPPEIGSLIDPVRATSAVLVDQRMKKIGMAMSRREAADIARQSEGALLQRLHAGGTDMPSFPYLSEAEIRSLVAYLQLLAGVPGTEKKQVEIRVSRARVGRTHCEVHLPRLSRRNRDESLSGGAFRRRDPRAECAF